MHHLQRGRSLERLLKWTDTWNHQVLFVQFPLLACRPRPPNAVVEDPRLHIGSQSTFKHVAFMKPKRQELDFLGGNKSHSSFAMDYWTILKSFWAEVTLLILLSLCKSKKWSSAFFERGRVGVLETSGNLAPPNTSSSPNQIPLKSKGHQKEFTDVHRKSFW